MLYYPFTIGGGGGVHILTPLFANALNLDQSGILSLSKVLSSALYKNSFQVNGSRIGQTMTRVKLEALERLYRSTGLIFCNGEEKFLTSI